LQELSLSLRMVPVRATFQKMARLVRDLSKKINKPIDFHTFGDETELDKTVVDQIGDPLMHMVRNSVDHGIEASIDERLAAGKPAHGQIVMRAFHRGGNIHIEIEDDGRGLDRERILAKARERGLIEENAHLTDRETFGLIFQPGFSTAEKITDVSGRGVGMDVVRRNIEALRGSVEMRSEAGRGTCFTMRLPLTLAIIDGMVVRVGENRYIIPTLSVVELLRLKSHDVSTVKQRGEMFQVRERLLPLLRVAALFEQGILDRDPASGITVVVEGASTMAGLLVDEVLGQQQAVIKNLGKGLEGRQGIAGGAIMPDGKVGLILDIHGLLEMARKPASESSAELEV
jgi:two-component system chemotaxis sensor kinase CheA